VERRIIHRGPRLACQYPAESAVMSVRPRRVLEPRLRLMAYALGLYQATSPSLSEAPLIPTGSPTSRTSTRPVLCSCEDHGPMAAGLDGEDGEEGGRVLCDGQDQHCALPDSAVVCTV
jgi:hypothetical protein